MKKILKNPLFTFIIGIIISGTTVYAVSAINANQIAYTDSNNQETTVKSALDNVYNNLDSRIVLNTFGNTTYQTSQGTPQTTRSITKSITKGKYLIAVSFGEAWNDSGDYAAGNGVTDFSTLSCTSNNCILRKIGGYYNQPKATEPIVQSYKAMMYSGINIYYAEIKEDSDTLSTYVTAAATYNTGAQFITIQAIPIN